MPTLQLQLLPAAEAAAVWTTVVQTTALIFRAGRYDNNAPSQGCGWNALEPRSVIHACSRRLVEMRHRKRRRGGPLAQLLLLCVKFTLLNV